MTEFSFSYVVLMMLLLSTSSSPLILIYASSSTSGSPPAAVILTTIQGLQPDSTWDQCGIRPEQMGSCLQGYATTTVPASNNNNNNTAIDNNILFSFNQTVGGNPAENAQTLASLASWEYHVFYSEVTIAQLGILFQQGINQYLSENSSVSTDCGPNSNACLRGNAQLQLTSNWNSILITLHTSATLNPDLVNAMQAVWLQYVVSIQQPQPIETTTKLPAWAISLSTVLPVVALVIAVYLAYTRKWYSYCLPASASLQLRIKALKDTLQIHTLWTMHQLLCFLVNVAQVAVSVAIIARPSSFDSQLVLLGTANLVEHLVHIVNYLVILFKWGGIRSWDAHSAQSHSIHYVLCLYTAAMAIYSSTVSDANDTEKTKLSYYFIVIYHWIHTAMQAVWLYQVHHVDPMLSPAGSLTEEKNSNNPDTKPRRNAPNLFDPTNHKTLLPSVTSPVPVNATTAATVVSPQSQQQKQPEQKQTEPLPISSPDGAQLQTQTQTQPDQQLLQQQPLQPQTQTPTQPDQQQQLLVQQQGDQPGASKQSEKHKKDKKTKKSKKSHKTPPAETVAPESVKIDIQNTIVVAETTTAVYTINTNQ